MRVLILLSLLLATLGLGDPEPVAHDTAESVEARAKREAVTVQADIVKTLAQPAPTETLKKLKGKKSFVAAEWIELNRKVGEQEAAVTALDTQITKIVGMFDADLIAKLLEAEDLQSKIDGTKQLIKTAPSEEKATFIDQKKKFENMQAKVEYQIKGLKKSTNQNPPNEVLTLRKSQRRINDRLTELAQISQDIMDQLTDRLGTDKTGAKNVKMILSSPKPKPVTSPE